MAEYNFVLTLMLPPGDGDGERHLVPLLENGCDDATVSMGRKGYLYLDFGREAASADEAIRSAMTACQRAVPGSEVVAVGPDLVNLSDVAAMTGCSRQNMRLYAIGESRAEEPFPPPASTGEPALWRLAEVAPWMARNTTRPFEDPLLPEVAAAAFHVNQRLQSDRAARSGQSDARLAAELRPLLSRILSRAAAAPLPGAANPLRLAEAVARLAGSGTVKTKLNKLMFYADFRHFRDFGESITGLPYVRFALGPVPQSYELLYATLEEAGVLGVSEEARGNFTASVISAGPGTPSGHLAPDQAATLDAVRTRFAQTDASGIVEVSHTEDAWLQTEPNGLIAYERARSLRAV